VAEEVDEDALHTEVEDSLDILGNEEVDVHKQKG